MRLEQSQVRSLALGVLWLLGTVGRVVAFAAPLVGVVLYDSWEADRYPDDGASFIFVPVSAAEFVVAGTWAAVDAWRRAPWLALTVRWAVVALTAALGITVSEMRDSALYSWADFPAYLSWQLVVIGGGAAMGVGVSREMLRPFRAR